MALEDFRADAMRCTRCTYCRWIPFDHIKSARFAKGCPSIEYGKFHTYSAGGRLITALSLMDGRSTVTERVKDAAFKCTMCGLCDVSCKLCRYDMEPLAAMRELRFSLVAQGHTLPQAAPVIDSLRMQFNMLGKQASARGDWAKTLKVKDLSTERAEVCFHAGLPLLVVDGDLGHVARTSVKILQKAGVDVGIFGAQEQCCGGRAFNMGYPRGLRAARHAQPVGVEEGGRQDDRDAVCRLLPRVQAKLRGRTRLGCRGAAHGCSTSIGSSKSAR